MNLDDFKNLTKQIAAPAEAPTSDAKLGGFIAKMRAHDQRVHRRGVGMAVGLFAVGVVLMASGRADQPGATLVGLGVLFVALYAGLRGRVFGCVNYAAPAQEFLAAAARRHQFWRLEDTLFAIPLLLTLGLGGGLTVWMVAGRYLGDRGTHYAIMAYGVFLVALCVFGWIVGRKQWLRESAPLLEEIRRRERDLQDG